MKITYLLKKGLQCYPPCLSQVLFLSDLGYNIEVFHGKNSSYINKILDKRQIKHHTFASDHNSRGKVDSAINYALFCREARKLQLNAEEENIIWVGNMETAMALNSKSLRKTKFILNVLELYNEGTIYDKWLKNNVKYANSVITCEKHRAAIMQSRYGLNSLPFVIPNKPHDLMTRTHGLKDDLLNVINHKFTVAYQGIISKDRPLESLAKGLSECNDDIVFLVMGKCSLDYQKKISSIYPMTYFTGYIPAPQHLEYTKHCDIGIANYDNSSLNNVFCAPNKIYEYAKYGIPVLCSKNIALEETIGKFTAGICIDFSNIECIVESISNIKNNYSEYSQNAIRFYNAIDIRQIIEKIVEQVR